MKECYEIKTQQGEQGTVGNINNIHNGVSGPENFFHFSPVDNSWHPETNGNEQSEKCEKDAGSE